MSWSKACGRNCRREKRNYPNEKYHLVPNCPLYRIKNIAEVATLCHYDIRLLSRTTVETVVLLNNKKVDGYIDIELNL